MADGCEKVYEAHKSSEMKVDDCRQRKGSGPSQREEMIARKVMKGNMHDLPCRPAASSSSSPYLKHLSMRQNHSFDHDPCLQVILRSIFHLPIAYFIVVQR